MSKQLVVTLVSVTFVLGIITGIALEVRAFAPRVD